MEMRLTAEPLEIKLIVNDAGKALIQCEMQGMSETDARSLLSVMLLQKLKIDDLFIFEYGGQG